MYRWNEPLGSISTEKEILETIDAYYDFAINVFDVLMEDMYGDIDWINVKFIISPELKFDSSDYAIYGDFNGGIIRLYLYSILKRVPKAMTCTIIISTLVHELKHAGQVIKSRDEFNDIQDYINNIERPVEWETLMYLTERREWLENKFGVAINLIAFKRYQMKYAAYNTGLYVPVTAETHWMNVLNFIYGDDNSLIETLIQDDVLNKEDTIVLRLVNGGKTTANHYDYAQYIKKNGIIYCPDCKLLQLAANIDTVADLDFDIETGWGENGTIYIIETTYNIIYNPPLIKYDKPYTT